MFKPASVFSVLTPTYKRPDNVIRLIESIKNTISKTIWIELLFYTEGNNDIESLNKIWDFVETLDCENSKLFINMIHDPSNDWYNKWWNFLWKESVGQYIMQCGDDNIFKTKNWDLMIQQEFQKYPDDIVLVSCNDGSCDAPNRATHPFVTSKWCETLGYFVPGIFNGGFNDTWLTDIAKEIGRFVYLDNVLIEHMHPDFGKSPDDEIYQKQRDGINQQNSIKLFSETKNKRIEDAKKLKQLME